LEKIENFTLKVYHSSIFGDTTKKFYNIISGYG